MGCGADEPMSRWKGECNDRPMAGDRSWKDPSPCCVRLLSGFEFAVDDWHVHVQTRDRLDSRRADDLNLSDRCCDPANAGDRIVPWNCSLSHPPFSCRCDAFSGPAESTRFRRWKLAGFTLLTTHPLTVRGSRAVSNKKCQAFPSALLLHGSGARLLSRSVKCSRSDRRTRFGWKPSGAWLPRNYG